MPFSIGYRLLLSVGMLSFGLFLLVKTKQFVDVVGMNEWGERYFGPGGTYTMWKVVGALLSFGSIIVLFWRL